MSSSLNERRTRLITHKKFGFKFGFNVNDVDNFTNIKLVESKVKGSTYKVLYVMDYVPSADLGKDTLLSGNGQETFDNVLNFAKLPTHDYLVVTFHACRTVGMSPIFVENAFESFERRLFDIVESYKPDKIVCFGRRPFSVICAKQMDLVADNHHYMIGVPVSKTITLGGTKKKIDITLSVPIDRMFSGDEACLSLIGYVADNLRNAHAGRVVYGIDRPEMVITVIDTIKRFNKFYKRLISEPIAAIDTETDNLYKIKNRVLTIQFAFDAEEAFIIPLCHKDSPFDKDELEYMFEKLRYYFEFVKVKYMIFANPQFDLAIMKTQFKIRYYCSSIWCVFAGQKAHDENYKWLQTAVGKYYYSLGNLACQFGDFSYLTGEFGKSDRVHIGSMDLDTPGLLAYCLSKDNYVLTNRGYVPIAEIRVNDSVLSFNHALNIYVYKPVTKVSEHETTEDMLEIDYGSGKIKVTENHEIWSVTRNSYIKAKDITEDDELLIELGNNVLTF